MPSGEEFFRFLAVRDPQCAACRMSLRAPIFDPRRAGIGRPQSGAKESMTRRRHMPMPFASGRNLRLDRVRGPGKEPSETRFTRQETSPKKDPPGDYWPCQNRVEAAGPPDPPSGRKVQ